MSIKLDIKDLIREEIELDVFVNALSEVSGENAQIFNLMLDRCVEQPKNKSLKRTVLDNIKILNNSINILSKSKYMGVDKDIQSLVRIMKSMEDYFSKHGLDTDIGKQLRKAYLKINAYLKEIRNIEEYHSTKEKDSNDVNQIYLCAYRKFLSENISRVNKGLNPKTKPEQWNIDSTSERGELQLLALEDSLRHLKSGIDFSKHRGDLRYVFGSKNRSQLNHELLCSVSNEILNKDRQKLIKEIKRKEGIETQELSEEQKLAKAIVAHAKRNIR